MKISEKFIQEILKQNFPTNYKKIYESSLLFQYLDKKMNAVHGDSKTRRSLGNIYAIYSILYFYVNDFYDRREEYNNFLGYDYLKLFNFYRGLYGGSKLQNHALNARVNTEFKNKFPSAPNSLIIADNGKYLIYIGYLYVQNKDISKIACKIIEKYIDLLIFKDNALIKILDELTKLKDYTAKQNKIVELLNENTEARIFEIISYAILKNHYKNIPVYIGFTKESIKEQYLELYKTGRTNANDGGIDFVMRPIGRFFQVTEVNNYDKYLLDIDKVMHFPVTFVIKTKTKKDTIIKSLDSYIELKSGGMQIIKNRYCKAVEEIITINELVSWIYNLTDKDIDGIIRDIDIYYKLEMNIECE